MKIYFEKRGKCHGVGFFPRAFRSICYGVYARRSRINISNRIRERGRWQKWCKSAVCRRSRDRAVSCPDSVIVVCVSGAFLSPLRFIGFDRISHRILRKFDVVRSEFIDSSKRGNVRALICIPRRPIISVFRVVYFYKLVFETAEEGAFNGAHVLCQRTVDVAGGVMVSRTDREIYYKTGAINRIRGCF